MNQQILGPKSGSGKVSDREPVRIWAALQHGDQVEVWSGGSLRYKAHIDDLAEDGKVIWVTEIGTGSRRLYVRNDPVTLYWTQDKQNP